MKRTSHSGSERGLRGWVYFLASGFLVVLFLLLFVGTLRRANVIVRDAKVNLLLLNGLTVASLDLNQNKLTLFRVPDDFLIDIIGGRGKYPARSSVKLVEGEKGGFSYLTDSLSISLGVGIDGWIDTRESNLLSVSEGVVKRGGFGEWIRFSLSRGTNLGFVDRLKLFAFIFSLSQDDFKITDKTNAYFEEISEPDGEKYLVVDKFESVDLFRELGADRRLLGEKLSVEIINTTGFPNLAREVGRIVRNASVRVVGEIGREGREGNEDFRCRIQVSRESVESETVGKLKRWFGCDVLLWDQKEKSELQLVLGRGYAIYLRGM